MFPGVRQVGSDGKDGVSSASSPTLLIRLRPGQTGQGAQGSGRLRLAGDNPEYLAFSKICTHAGCPASLYEQQTSRLLCPCHQSQFEVLEDAKPVFGPATRSLPKLPLDVEVGDDGRQYFVARSDFRRADRPRLLGALMSTTTTTKAPPRRSRAAHAAGQGSPSSSTTGSTSPGRCATS